MIDESAIKTQLHNIVTNLIEALFLPGLHPAKYVQETSDRLHGQIDLASFVIDTDE